MTAVDNFFNSTDIHSGYVWLTQLYLKMKLMKFSEQNFENMRAIKICGQYYESNIVLKGNFLFIIK